ncbi:Rv0361 family membrane protein [Williamsia muralis]|uniref:Mce-associated membrane protein n=1 Tax=Williamsia marianensis TaxID=85044 RepID=A0A2G3PIN6_WILMA|nr:hypothetical protein [Williamsia marianensis]PHV65665.1 hypothetical protein CSW57_18180 [Williamsia marianensis]
MSLTLPHPTHYVPVRTAALLALIVLVLNIALVWSALALRPAAAGDESQIRELVHQQIDALNHRDPAALSLTYCDQQAVVARQIVEALGPPSQGALVRVTRIADIQFIGSGDDQMATAHVTLAIAEPANGAISARPSELTHFTREQTGWKMCQPSDNESPIHYL